MYGPATAGTMHQGSPRQWPYASSNSPLPLPEHPVLFTRDDIVLLDRFSGEVSDDLLEGTLLKDYVSQFGTATTSLDDLLQELDAPLIADRRPILLQGELANPYRLQEMNMGPLPLLTVRLEGICRTWADGLDPRDAYPGIHHVTLARTPGWWERSHLGLASKEQLKLIREWLDNGVRSTWRPVKLGEGGVRFEHDSKLEPPSSSDVEWDGTNERVSIDAPPPTGPSISLDELLVVVHTRQGCYNHRGRLARCVHMHQRPFHEGLFRKGSSHRWNEILTLR
jgi:hypothetical protein|tara:strand:- start:1206 stop:2048 length:843 start_codon:yes stop_codon:yes gene_type:complete